MPALPRSGDPGMNEPIPFSRPCLVGPELDYLAQAARQGKLSADGPFTARCAQWLENTLGLERVLMTHSASGALDLALRTLGLAAGDEVLLPSFTYVATANAVLANGGRPVFVEIEPETLCLDLETIEAARTARCRVVVPVHYAGASCDLPRLSRWAAERQIDVVEDAAQAVGSRFADRALGGWGALGVFSFTDQKNVTGGQAGALTINRADLFQRAQTIRDQGTDRARYFRGEVPEYTWTLAGGSYAPSELCCAFLLAQLEQFEAVTNRRREQWQFYRAALGPLEARGVVRLPKTLPGCEPNFHLFYLLAADRLERDRLIAHLAQQGITAPFHFVPLHLSAMGIRLGYGPGDLPRTEDLAGRIVRLPLFHDLTRPQQERVVGAVREFYRGNLPTRPAP